jgi:hypothetical protein
MVRVWCSRTLAMRSMISLRRQGVFGFGAQSAAVEADLHPLPMRSAISLRRKGWSPAVNFRVQPARLGIGTQELSSVVASAARQQSQAARRPVHRQVCSNLA